MFWLVFFDALTAIGLSPFTVIHGRDVGAAASFRARSDCRRIVHALLKFCTGRPADPSQGVDERAALDCEVAAARPQ
jgi:hypothetical protein